MAVQTEQTPQEGSQRAVFMCNEDSTRYHDFMTDLFLGKFIKSWSLVFIMQLFTLPDDLWLGEDVFLGSIICFNDDAKISWMWVDWEWHFDIRSTSEEIQEIVVSDTFRREFRALTWGTKTGWQLLGDEKIVFEDDGPRTVTINIDQEELFPSSED